MVLSDKEINGIVFQVAKEQRQAQSLVGNKKVLHPDVQVEDVSDYLGVVLGESNQSKRKPLIETNEQIVLSVPKIKAENPLVSVIKENSHKLALLAKKLEDKKLTEEYETIADIVKELAVSMKTECGMDDMAMGVEAPAMPTSTPEDDLSAMSQNLSALTEQLNELCTKHESMKPTAKAMVEEAARKVGHGRDIMAEAHSHQIEDEKAPGKVQSMEVMAMEDVEKAYKMFGFSGLLEGVRSFAIDNARAATKESTKRKYILEGKMIREIVSQLEE